MDNSDDDKDCFLETWKKTVIYKYCNILIFFGFIFVSHDDNYFDDPTKLFPDLCLAKFFSKIVLSCTIIRKI